ncbi:MAG: hypothetical protein AB1589_33485 [Cyanobacteriota bacterium]
MGSLTPHPWCEAFAFKLVDGVWLKVGKEAIANTAHKPNGNSSENSRNRFIFTKFLRSRFHNACQTLVQAVSKMRGSRQSLIADCDCVCHNARATN